MSRRDSGDAMTSFVGGRRATDSRSGSIWQQKYEGSRSSKFKPEVREKLISKTTPHGPPKSKNDRKRPSALRMLKNFYDGVKNPETRAEAKKRGASIATLKRFRRDEFYSDERKRIAEGEADAEVDGLGDGGVIGELLDREMVDVNDLSENVRQQLKVKYDNRPYFTTWIMFVNTLIMIITLCTQPFAPVGFKEKTIQSQLMRHNMAYETVGYNQSTNFWIGPDFQSLIHLGAKYSPCMRKDKLYFEKIANDTAIEDTTGCCYRADLKTCWQSSQEDCGSTFAEWLDGKVCGLGAAGCSNPELSLKEKWVGKYSTWPDCPVDPDKKKDIPTIDGANKDLTCEVSARPCCIGLQGECLIISQEECKFKQGFFHENKTLCSQVSCITDICGLSGFILDNVPDQFYRAILPTFMHAGIIHLLITLVFQFYVLHDIEKVTGWWRIAIVYLSSGIGGTMFSAILIPYQPEIGASGALYGILAALVVEVIINWQLYKSPWMELIKLIIPILIFFLFGLMPWIDNFAHIGGFTFGFLTSFVFLPHINFSEEDRIAKLVVKIVCGVVALIFFFLLFIIFYLAQGSTCENCKYLNCIPFDETFCQDSSQDLRPRVGY